MSYTVTKYPHGTFSWADAMSTDAEATKKFMVELMGWKAEDMPTDTEGVVYTMFSHEGHSVAGLGQMPPHMEHVPSHWNSYITVDDLDAALQKVESAGGKVTMPKMKVMTAGKMAGIADPTGASFMLWEAGDTIGAGLVNTVGAMGWNELRTTDTAAAKKFYTTVFGWTYDSMDKEYDAIKNNGRMNGGIMPIAKDWGDVPPHWAVYFTVADIDQTVEKAKKLGGSVQGEVIDAGEGIGRFAMITDPTGAQFVAIQLSDAPEHWEE
jgi:predicted enzyme related to lactoylglutathione lyase